MRTSSHRTRHHRRSTQLSASSCWLSMAASLAKSCDLASPCLAFQIWSNSNSKFRKFNFKFPKFQVVILKFPNVHCKIVLHFLENLQTWNFRQNFINIKQNHGNICWRHVQYKCRKFKLFERDFAEIFVWTVQKYVLSTSCRSRQEQDPYSKFPTNIYLQKSASSVF